MTVNDLLTRALNDLGVYGAGEVPSAEDIALALDRLNDWIDGLKTESLSVFALTRSTWTITGASSYTVGSGGTVNIDRPVAPQDIGNIGYQDNSLTPAQEVLFGRALTQQEYEGIPAKSMTAVYPASWYYNPTFGSTALGTLTPWPIPTSSTLVGVIYAPSQVAEYAAITDVIYLPPGYRRFLRTNVAVEIAPAFHAQPDQTLLQAAGESKANVKRKNYRLKAIQMPDVSALFGNGAPSNIYSGY